METNRIGTADVVSGLIAVLSDRYREMYPNDLVGIRANDLHEGLEFLKLVKGYDYLAIDYGSMDGILHGLGAFRGYETIFPGRMIMSPNQSRGHIASIEVDYGPEVRVRETLNEMADEYIQYFKDKEKSGLDEGYLRSLLEAKSSTQSESS